MLAVVPRRARQQCVARVAALEAARQLPARPVQWMFVIVAVLVLFVIGIAIKGFVIERWQTPTSTVKPGQVGTQTQTVAPSPTARVGSISLLPPELTLPADGQSIRSILIQVRDRDRKLVPQRRVTFSFQGPGVLTPGGNEAMTNQGGEVTLTYTSGTIPGQAILRVSVDEAAAILVITLTTLPVTSSP